MTINKSLVNLKNMCMTEGEQEEIRNNMQKLRYIYIYIYIYIVRERERKRERD